MKKFTVSLATKALYKMIDKVAESHKPVQIVGKRHDAVLVSDKNWRAIQETLHLLSIPGMRKSIRKGLKIPVKTLPKNIEVD